MVLVERPKIAAGQAGLTGKLEIISLVCDFWEKQKVLARLEEECPRQEKCNPESGVECSKAGVQSRSRRTTAEEDCARDIPCSLKNLGWP